MDWDALSGLIGVLIWILVLAFRGRRHMKSPGPRAKPARTRGEVKFERDYEPIEPK